MANCLRQHRTKYRSLCTPLPAKKIEKILLNSYLYDFILEQASNMQFICFTLMLLFCKHLYRGKNCFYFLRTIIST